MSDVNFTPQFIELRRKGRRWYDHKHLLTTCLKTQLFQYIETELRVVIVAVPSVDWTGFCGSPSLTLIFSIWQTPKCSAGPPHCIFQTKRERDWEWPWARERKKKRLIHLAQPALSSGSKMLYPDIVIPWPRSPAGGSNTGQMAHAPD